MEKLATAEGWRLYIWLIYSRAALKAIYMFGRLRGTLVTSKVLGGFFVSSEIVSYPDESGQKFENITVLLGCRHFIKGFNLDVLFLYRAVLVF